MQSVRTLLVEDFGPMRRLIRSELLCGTGLQLIGEATDGLEAVQKAEEFQPDLILLDVGLPKLNGLEAARQFGRLVPRAKVLFCSLMEDPEVIREALRLGGCGYIHKSRIQTDLLSAVEAVLRGETFISDGLEYREGACAAVDFRQRLEEINSNLARADRLPDLLYELLDAGIEITGADFGNIQLFDQETSELRLMAHRGFDTEFVRFFETLHCGDNCACGTAFKSQKRIIVEDVASDPIFGDGAARRVILSTDTRACQSTPLFTQTGEPLGMLNTHHRRPCRPPKEALQLLDLVALRAGNLMQQLCDSR